MGSTTHYFIKQIQDTLYICLDVSDIYTDHFKRKIPLSWKETLENAPKSLLRHIFMTWEGKE